ncbi:hypothetical protein C7434_0990 [Pantoea sp. PNA 14-12]|uniref:Lipoprotein n=1 Tax=Pantoea stewartii TaxID=66269 RepID=A0AB34V974_9GAMM|nr:MULTISPECIES: hypothetical protein [Pantoea]KHE03451.1 hypothetical protein NL54_02445 [Pantoea stewartii]KHN61850.1 hypothetical protein OI73_13375 [Pantoea stewartii]KTS28132.1 hypothetical protein NS381_12280 [Pantoea stewartii]KTS70301.1 hypothetical protein RSA30_22025 [Pantoea stewartii]KTS94163.1 hypothetical protein RSA13_19110 [Pantoea stewartii]
MKWKGAWLLCLLLAGCDKPNDTQLITETGRELQRTIDTSSARLRCEEIAKGRERLSRDVRQKLEAQHCQNVLRSATETNFTDTTIYRHNTTMICGGILGKSFTGSMIYRRFIYSPDEKALVIEPVSEADKTRFEGQKTVQQLQDDFNRQHQQYCQ